jgi:pimeloyl-ACP methyl ester carboxylesterase
MTPLRLQLQPAPGERIAVDVLPGAPPAYVWLHVFGASRAGEHSNALFAHAAARGRAAARFDFRGHGDSTGTIGVTTTRDLVADALAVLAHTAPAVLVGHSLGALVAALAAAVSPTAVCGLVLLAPSLDYRSVLRRCLGADGRLRTPDGRTFPVRPAVLDDADGLDERAIPPRLPMPLLLVHGEQDEVVAPAAAAAFAAAVPHARKDLWLVPGADHRLSGVMARALARADALFAARP